MRYYHLRLSKEKQLDEAVIRERLESGFIGLDLKDDEFIYQPLDKAREPVDNKRLEAMLQAFSKIKVDDLVLIRNDRIPVALIKVTGDYIFRADAEDWCRHAYPIEIIEYYSDYMERYNEPFYLPRLGVIFREAGEEIYTYIERWHNSLDTRLPLESIRICNYKNFYDFEVVGFKRINLITGENNIGKTNFLEACYIYLENQRLEKDDYLYALHDIIKMRGLSCKTRSILNQDCLFKSITYDNENKEIKIISSRGKDILLKRTINRHYDEYTSDLLVGEPKKDRIWFIPASSISDHQLTELYSSIQYYRKKEFLNQSIRDNFGREIEEFDVISKKPNLYLSSRQNWVSYNEFGDGLKRFITILSALWASKNGVCFIDEIENGLHYSLHDKLWNLIFETAKEANCQLFITTHSAEIISSISKISKEKKETNIALITLFKSKNNDIAHINYDAEMLDDELWQDHEVRGW